MVSIDNGVSNGFMPAVMRNIKAEVNYIDWFKHLAEVVSSQYTVQGKITNALDSSPISNVKMRFINHYEQKFETESIPTRCHFQRMVLLIQSLMLLQHPIW